MEIQRCIVHKNRRFIVGDGVKIWTEKDFFKGRLHYIYSGASEITIDCSKDYESIKIDILVKDIINIESFPNADVKREE